MCKLDIYTVTELNFSSSRNTIATTKSKQRRPQLPALVNFIIKSTMATVFPMWKSSIRAFIKLSLFIMILFWLRYFSNKPLSVDENENKIRNITQKSKKKNKESKKNSPNQNNNFSISICVPYIVDGIPQMERQMFI